MIKEIVFDMDGTIADLYGVENWLEMLRTSDPTPYKIAEPLTDMAELANLLSQCRVIGIEVSVVTWLSKVSTPDYDKAVREAKKEWLNNHDFPFDHFHGVKYGTPKHQVVKQELPKDGTALIFDDDARVRNAWTLGEAIDPTKENIIEILRNILEAR